MNNLKLKKISKSQLIVTGFLVALSNNTKTQATIPGRPFMSASPVSASSPFSPVLDDEEKIKKEIESIQQKINAKRQEMHNLTNATLVSLEQDLERLRTELKDLKTKQQRRPLKVMPSEVGQPQPQPQKSSRWSLMNFLGNWYQQDGSKRSTATTQKLEVVAPSLSLAQSEDKISSEDLVDPKITDEEIREADLQQLPDVSATQQSASAAPIVKKDPDRVRFAGTIIGQSRNQVAPQKLKLGAQLIVEGVSDGLGAMGKSMSRNGKAGLKATGNEIVTAAGTVGKFLKDTSEKIKTSVSVLVDKTKTKWKDFNLFGKSSNAFSSMTSFFKRTGLKMSCHYSNTKVSFHNLMTNQLMKLQASIGNRIEAHKDHAVKNEENVKQKNQKIKNLTQNNKSQESEEEKKRQ